MCYLTIIQLTDGQKFSAKAFTRVATDIYGTLYIMQKKIQLFPLNDNFCLFIMKSLLSRSRLVPNRLAF